MIPRRSLSCTFAELNESEDKLDDDSNQDGTEGNKRACLGEVDATLTKGRNNQILWIAQFDIDTKLQEVSNVSVMNVPNERVVK